MIIFADAGQTFGILFGIIGVIVVLGLISFIIYRKTHPKLKDSEKPTQEEILKENLDRYLKPIEDEETEKEVANYKEKDD